MTFTIVLIYPARVGVGEHSYIYVTEATDVRAAEKDTIKKYKDPIVVAFRGMPERFLVIEGKPASNVIVCE